MMESDHPYNSIFWASVDILRSMVGHRMAHVCYKGSIDTPHGVDQGDPLVVHEVDQAVVISTESATMVLEWCIRDYSEFLNVVASPTEGAAAAVTDIHDVASLPPWSSLVGSVIVGFGVATQQSEEGYELLWAIRINFDNGASAVVALGELQGMAPNYQPDNLLVIFDPEVAQSYQILGAPESAWGRDLRL